MNRGKLVALRQIESASGAPWSVALLTEPRTAMAEPDATLKLIAAQFMRYDVEKSGGRYVIIDRRSNDPVARLRPIEGTDRFELFYWSNIKDRWTTFGNMGRMKLPLEDAREIVEGDPMFRVPRRR